MIWDAKLLRLTPSARYALQGMAFLAKSEGTSLLVQDIAVATGLPRHFLAKIFQRLASRGLLTSRRGKRGGYALARPAARITLQDVLAAATAEPAAVRQCFLYERACDSLAPCLLHEAVAKSSDDIVALLAGRTLADLASDPQRPAGPGPAGAI